MHNRRRAFFKHLLLAYSGKLNETLVPKKKEKSYKVWLYASAHGPLNSVQQVQPLCVLAHPFEGAAVCEHTYLAYGSPCVCERVRGISAIRVASNACTDTGFRS